MGEIFVFLTRFLCRRPSTPCGRTAPAALGILLFAGCNWLSLAKNAFTCVFSLGNPLRPRLTAGPHTVPVGPFSGTSTSAGLCVVSGGTSLLHAWRYDTSGALSGPIAAADLGRGQPDALVAGDGLCEGTRVDRRVGCAKVLEVVDVGGRAVTSPPTAARR